MGWQLGVGNFIPTYEIGTRSGLGLEPSIGFDFVDDGFDLV